MNTCLGEDEVSPHRFQIRIILFARKLYHVNVLKQLLFKCIYLFHFSQERTVLSAYFTCTHRIIPKVFLTQLEQIKKYNNLGVDKDGVIVHFEEKPKEPVNTLTAIALYYYSPAVLSLVTTYIAAGNNPDQPGRFIQWLYRRKPVKTVKISGKWFDVGSKETLEEANRIFAQFRRAV